MNTLKTIKNPYPEELNKKIFSTEAIRASAQKMALECQSGATHFLLNEDLLPAAADYVIALIQKRYPDLNVPYHSRWRHYEVGNYAQLNSYQKLTSDYDQHDKARIGLDLVIPSVLIDAGAGAKWQYQSENSKTVGRSEGLGIASLDAFLSGAFSKNKSLKTDAEGLKAITDEQFKSLFKVTKLNPMLGVEGRVALLNSLGNALNQKPEVFKNRRPGDLVDYILEHFGTSVSAQTVLQLIIQNFGDIWPGRLIHKGINLGDTWHYKPFGDDLDSFVPIHKLSQWISYSVIETLENNGFTVSGLDKLTGLAEYRNGGLMIDFGLLALRDKSNETSSWAPSSQLIVEWRALTIYLLDKLGEVIQSKLGMTAQEFPLAKILEGGTWAAGRAIALEQRDSSEPPINILSDGTVF